MGYVYAVLAVFFWSFNVIVAKYFVDTFTPWQISFYRWFFASVILFPFVVKEIYKNGDIYFKYWKKVLLYSIFGIILMNTFSYVAAQTISAVEMSLIGVMGPVFIVILSRIFLKIKVSKLQIIGKKWVLIPDSIIPEILQPLLLRTGFERINSGYILTL